MKADPGNEIVRRVYAAKTDNAEADDDRIYGFIKAETARHLGRFVRIKMMNSVLPCLLYDAIQKYDHNSGALSALPA